MQWKFLTILICFLSFLVLSILSCSSKKEENFINSFLWGDKFKVANYVKQLRDLEVCLEGLPLDIYNDLLSLQRIYTTTGFNNVKHKRTNADQSNLIKGRFIDCIQIVAEDLVHKEYCDIIEEAEEDLLAKYAIAEYWECIKSKNNKHKTLIEFTIPSFDVHHGVGPYNSIAND